LWVPALYGLAMGDSPSPSYIPLTLRSSDVRLKAGNFSNCSRHAWWLNIESSQHAAIDLACTLPTR
jgi:hypothetical protein